MNKKRKVGEDEDNGGELGQANYSLSFSLAGLYIHVEMLEVVVEVHKPESQFYFPIWIDGDS